MTDVMTREQRLACMRRIRGRDTLPEQRVRALLQRWGFAFDDHVPGLPGRPDFVFPERRLVIFVHGCFWHRHSCPEGQPWPKQNSAFWQKKLSGNQNRDRRIEATLKAAGWEVLVVWECETAVPRFLEGRLLTALLYPAKMGGTH